MRAQGAREPAGAVGRVNGVVFDSLLGRPLPGATVWVEGLGRSALSDARGAFILDSVPSGDHAIGAGHPALDSIGLPTLATRVLVPAGGAVATLLATPSRERLFRTFCGPETAHPAGSPHGGPARPRPEPGPAAGGGYHGVLVGTVLDARPAAVPGTRLAGVQVTARYVLPRRGQRALPLPTAVSAWTDSVGQYAVCGLPGDVELVVRASGGGAESGPAYLALGARGMAVLGLALDLEAPLASPPLTVLAPAQAAALAEASATARPRLSPSTRAPAHAGTVLHGVVRDSAGAAGGGVRVRVADRTDLEARTDSAGRFTLRGIGRGTQSILVSAVGYLPQATTVDVRGAASDTVVIILQRAAQLARVTVRARYESRAAFTTELEHRRRLGGGSFLDSTTVAQRGTLRDAFTLLPFVRLAGSAVEWRLEFWAPSTSISAPDHCRPDIRLDNTPVDESVLAALPADQVLAIEVYRRDHQAPAQYRSMKRCGVVLVWTKGMG
jgi:hypothetical protein